MHAARHRPRHYNQTRDQESGSLGYWWFRVDTARVRPPPDPAWGMESGIRQPGPHRDIAHRTEVTVYLVVGRATRSVVALGTPVRGAMLID
jgi:hypothetical protein